MPGLLTLRPLASAAKAAKTASAKNAVSAARAEKAQREERSQGQGRDSTPTLARGRVLRAPALHRTAPPPPPHIPAVPLQPAKPKQVTAPLGEVVKGKVLNITQRVGIDYSSSGSEHEPNSVCLAEMVSDYIEDDNFQVGKCGRARCNCDSSCGAEPSLLADNDDSRSSLGGEIADVLQGLTTCITATERTILAAVVSTLKALEDQSNSDKKESNPSTRRWVMTTLRASGYNAAICKSRWEHAGGFPGGDYQYIDVVYSMAGKSERIIIDIDFKNQFEIARPTSLYSSLLQLLPSIYVGKADRLQQIVNIMCDAAKRSLKKKGMHLPPWRKPEYIKAKWFSFYLRTTNESSLKSSPDYGRDIEKTALGGSAWDSKFTHEMEKSMYHQKLAASDSRKVLRECNAELGSRATMLPSRLSMLGQSSKVPLPCHGDDEPEGKVRGANRMGMLAGFLSSSDGVALGGIVSEDAADWEPPVVIPRNRQQQKAAAGLARILMEAGLTEDLSRRTSQEPRQQQQQQQFGGLSKQIAMAV